MAHVNLMLSASTLVLWGQFATIFMLSFQYLHEDSAV
jgi:hypothetical protein